MSIRRFKLKSSVYLDLCFTISQFFRFKIQKREILTLPHFTSQHIWQCLRNAFHQFAENWLRLQPSTSASLSQSWQHETYCLAIYPAGHQYAADKVKVSWMELSGSQHDHVEKVNTLWELRRVQAGWKLTSLTLIFLISCLKPPVHPTITGWTRWYSA